MADMAGDGVTGTRPGTGAGGVSADGDGGGRSVPRVNVSSGLRVHRRVLSLWRYSMYILHLLYQGHGIQYQTCFST